MDTAALYYTILHYITRYYISLHTLYYTIFITLHYSILYYITLRCIESHCIVLWGEVRLVIRISDLVKNPDGADIDLW